MEQPSLERRVEILEQTVDALQDLPPRMAAVEAQIVQLRTDMNNGFCALSYKIKRIHTEMMARFDQIDRRFDAMDARFDTMDRRFDAMDKRFDAQDAEGSEIKQRIA